MGFLSNQKERAMRYEEDLEKKRQEFLSTRIAGIEKIVFDIVGAYPDEGSVRFVIDYDDSCFEFTVDGIGFIYYAKGRYICINGTYSECVLIKKICDYCGKIKYSNFCYNPIDVLKEYGKDVECTSCLYERLSKPLGNNNKKGVFDYMRDWWKGCFG